MPGRAARDATVTAQIDTESAGRRGDPHGPLRTLTSTCYRFEFRDEDNADEVEQRLSYEPGPQVERLVAELDDLAKGRTSYCTGDAKMSWPEPGRRSGAQLLPESLREQFWDRRDRIKRADYREPSRTRCRGNCCIPGPGQGQGFLVEQFPVTRAVFGRRPARTLHLGSARFVLPSSSPPEAQAEIDAVRRILELGQPLDDVLRARRPLLDLIENGRFRRAALRLPQQLRCQARAPRSSSTRARSAG